MFHIIAIIILLCFSAFFSGSETALFSLTNFQKKRIETNHPHRTRVISILLDSPRRTLATILIGNMLVNITATSIVTTIFIYFFGHKGVSFAIIFMGLIILVFGEITPKTTAIRSPEGFSLFCCYPLHIFGKIIWPLRRALRFVADIFISSFVFKGETKPYITHKELKALMTISEKEGIIDKEEKEMLHSIFDLGKRSVYEIMTPRVDMVAVGKNITAAELVEIMKSTKYTKIPVYDKSIDHIIGVIYTKEFMLNQKDSISEFIKKVIYVPETEKINNLLLKFQSEKIYIAIVLDEFGGTAGVVTLEDVLEEVVGDIRDEYDEELPPVKREDDGTYTIIGKTAIRDVNEELKVDLPTEEVSTINGLLLLLFGRVPKPNETIRFKGMEFRVLEIKDNIVTKVQAKVLY